MFESIKKGVEKIGAWGQKRADYFYGKGQAIQDKRASKTNEYLEKFLNSEGQEKANAKSALFASASVLQYPAFTVDYVGGHPDHSTAKDDIKVMVLPQGIILSILPDLISWEEIKNINFKSSEQIQRDVTLTRMLAFGVYSLALKKKRKIINKYLVLSCDKFGMGYSMAFASGKTDLLYSAMFNTKGKYMQLKEGAAL
ncbi:hypothetical protein SCB17_003106 [Clostridium perfringens]|nr:hypothetical protein [Clostridium perfringens]